MVKTTIELLLKTQQRQAGSCYQDEYNSGYKDAIFDVLSILEMDEAGVLDAKEI